MRVRRRRTGDLHRHWPARLGVPRQGLALLAACLAIGAGVALAQGDRGGVTGTLSDPVGAELAGIEVVLTGIDVRATYTARTNDEGRFDFPSVAPGGYRVEVRQSALVAMTETLKVGSGQRLMADLRTALRVRIELTLGAASAEALRQWVAGGRPPATPLAWECAANGERCAVPEPTLSTARAETPPDAPVAMPLLLQPYLGEIMTGALIAPGGRQGIVQMRGVIATDGFLSGLSVSAASSPELAAAALAELGRTQWEPARLKGVPANASVTLDLRF